jgi:hypothetical protein
MALTLKNLKKCGKCEMIGGMDSLGEQPCKNCCRIDKLEERIEEQDKRLEEMEKKIEGLMNVKSTQEAYEKQRQKEEQKRLDKMEKELKEIKGDNSGDNSKEKEAEWTTIVKKTMDKELKTVNDKMKQVEEQIKETAEEERRREERINNIVIHRLEESQEETGEQRMTEDKATVLELFRDVLKVNCEGKDIRKMFRMGKTNESNKTRPLLVEFRDRAIKNEVMESLGKLRAAEDKYTRISVAHDMTEGERQRCRSLVKESKEKQNKEETGEWIYKVKGWPGSMKIVKIKKNQ